MAKKYKQTKNIQENITHREIMKSPHLCNEMIYIPSDLNDIQPRSIKVWNWNEIGFDINGKWQNPSVIKTFPKDTACGGCKQDSEHNYYIAH